MTQNNSSFLPDNYVAPKGASNYMKFEKGKNKFRALSQPIIGWIDWTTDKKPVRFPMNEKPDKSIDPAKPVKFFWAFIVWNYQNNQIQILEITQKSIQAAIETLAKDADWGNPFKFDITVNKEGDGMDTEYTINPVPHKPIGQDVLDAYKAKPCYLEALYMSADPFAENSQRTPLNDLF